MSRTPRWPLVLLLVLLQACGEEPMSPGKTSAFGKGGGGGGGGAVPNPEIVFRQLERKQVGYYVINADGSAKALVASGLRDKASPSWSKQGTGTSADPYRFVWGDVDPVSGQGCELYVTSVVVSGSSVTGLPRVHQPTTPKDAAHPDQSLACGAEWSPVGPEIAYSTGSYAGSSGGPELWIVNVPPAPAGDRLVYAGDWSLGSPTWSRDGSHILISERSPDYTLTGDRLVLIEVATGNASVLLQEPANWMLADVEFANLSNDFLYRRTRYDVGCTPSCSPETGQGLYRLALDAAYLPGTPELLLYIRNGSWAPDDASFVGEPYGGGLIRYTFATGTVTQLLSQGKLPDWR